jgi:hypothetical protein
VHRSWITVSSRSHARPRDLTGVNCLHVFVEPVLGRGLPRRRPPPTRTAASRAYRRPRAGAGSTSSRRSTSLPRKGRSKSHGDKPSRQRPPRSEIHFRNLRSPHIGASTPPTFALLAVPRTARIGSHHWFRNPLRRLPAQAMSASAWHRRPGSPEPAGHLPSTPRPEPSLARPARPASLSLRHGRCLARRRRRGKWQHRGFLCLSLPHRTARCYLHRLSRLERDRSRRYRPHRRTQSTRCPPSSSEP